MPYTPQEEQEVRDRVRQIFRGKAVVTPEYMERAMKLFKKDEKRYGEIEKEVKTEEIEKIRNWCG